MRKLTLIIPLVILIILSIFCGDKNPAGGELLNTFTVDSITVQLAGVSIAAHEIDVKIDEYSGQIHIHGLFKYYKEVGGEPVSTDFNFDDWYNIVKEYLGDEVTITGSSISTNL